MMMLSPFLSSLSFLRFVTTTIHTNNTTTTTMMRMIRLIIILWIGWCWETGLVTAFESSNAQQPHHLFSMNRKTLAGLWRLTTTTTTTSFPMKEFTVYPKSKDNSIRMTSTYNTNNTSMVQPPQQELLLMLKEDGSFQQCKNKENSNIDQLWNRWQQKLQPQQNKNDEYNNNINEKQDEKDETVKIFEQLQDQFLHGIWDYRDGKLILAADRIDLISSPSDDVVRHRTTKQQQQQHSSIIHTRKHQTPSDTLVTGRVVAKYQQVQSNNPQLWNNNNNQTLPVGNKITMTNLSSLEHERSSNKNIDKHHHHHRWDTYLSVPKGSIKVGRFFYPKKHPSFFDQPMFQPKKRCTVTLRQILGTANQENDDNDKEDKYGEQFRTTDFYNKTFLLTSHPIGYTKPKKDVSPKMKTRGTTEQHELTNSENIRVLQIQFHSNNTFSTVAGVGENILRGKFSIMGTQRDQLWMQISRFGFGRSVSGSVFSEGNSISHEDAKSYWGTIRYREDTNRTSTTVGNIPPSESNQSIEVQGSVLFGWGIEPIPEARFIMREIESIVDSLEDEEEDDDDDNNNETSFLQLDENYNISTLGEEDGIHLSDSESFQ